MRPFRFALVTTDYPPYSEGREGLRVQWLARALAMRGHQVEVIHDTDAYRIRTGRVPNIPEQSHGIRVHRLRSSLGRMSRWGQSPRLGSVVHATRLREILQGRFDVVHFHDVEGLGGPAVWEMGTGIKFQSVEDFGLICPTGDLKRNGTMDCTGPACTGCLLRQRMAPARARIRREVHTYQSEIDLFLMQSRPLIEGYRRFGFRRPMMAIPPFLPESTPVLRPAVEALHTRPFFLFKGELTRQTGLADILAEYSDDIQADFLILGDGPDAAALRKIARQRSNVMLLGREAPGVQQSLIREALALVLPRDQGGPFPWAALEAFREGTPVITEYAGVGGGLVNDTGGGYRYKTPPELRAIFYRMAHDPAHARELGRRAFSGHARFWREDVAINAYFDEIRDVAIRRSYSGILDKFEGDAVRHNTIA